jgi:hypothetical protein
MNYIFVIVLIALASCSFKKGQLENQILKGHSELYSEPEAPKINDLGEFEKRIIIASTNDIHGNYNPDSYKFRDDHNKNELQISIGYRNVMRNYFNILREQYGNVILVDGGDIFGDSDKISETTEFYEENKYDAVTVGLRDFNLRVPAKINNTKLFQDFAKKSSVPLLLSNLYELKTARTVEWTGSRPYLMKEIDGMKVGIIGLVPDDIVKQTPVHNRVGLFVENMLQSTLKHARLLRSLGADIIVVLTHQGIDCSTEIAEKTGLPLSKVNFEPQKKENCNLKGDLGEYLERLPHNLVDVVIGGRNHQKIANFVNGILVMGSFPDGKSFNYAELVINSKTNKIVSDRTIVHQPVMFCHEFFKETNDCYFEDKTINHKNRVPAKFLGKQIEVPKIAHTENKKFFLDNSSLISKKLILHKADLSYLAETSGDTQLLIINVIGKDLVRILDEDYNQGRAMNWQPSPFLVKDHQLSVLISGLELDLNKTYRILTDLESIQMHKILIKQVSSFDSEALMSSSWSANEEDTVSIQLTAGKR